MGGCIGKRNKVEPEPRNAKTKNGSPRVDSVKMTKGGVAFELLLDDRPVTPFRAFSPRPGTSQMIHGDKTDDVMIRREIMLMEKTQFARDAAAKRAAAKERKLNTDIDALHEEYTAQETCSSPLSA